MGQVSADQLAGPLGRLAYLFDECARSFNLRGYSANAPIRFTWPIRPLVLMLPRRVLEHHLDQAGPFLRHGIRKGLIECRHRLDFKCLHAHAASDIRPFQVRITEVQ